jgi:MFS family permease
MTADVAGERAAAPAAIEPLKGPYRGYAMSLLLGLYIVNFLDRQVVNILAEPIKQDLNLADWQLGLMSGLAFAVFYTFMGIPIARLAEHGNRPVIIGVAAGVWSAFTVLCGMAQNFWQLILARIGVGVGEAGCTPPAHSLIMDYSAPEKRGSALAFYGMGAPLGTLLGMAFGGVVADAHGWRAAFLVAGLPGLIFAILAAFTLREPRRALALHADRVRAASASMAETVRLLMSKRSYMLMVSAMSLKSFISYGYVPFLASFFLRNHKAEVASTAGSVGTAFGVDLQSVGFLGIALGLLAGVCGAIGMWTGGQISDRLGPADPRRYLYIPAIASVICVPVFLGVMTAPWLELSLALVGVHALFTGIWYGPCYSAAFSVVPPHMRATSSAVVLFLTNLIGLGLGPLAVGVVSDLYATQMGAAEGVRWALATFSVAGLIAAVIFWAASRHYMADRVS